MSSLEEALDVDEALDIDEALEVEDGMFKTKSIVWDKFDLVPKGFHQKQLNKCVYRKEHVTTIMSKLRAMVRRENSNYPGLYLQGPAGVGKSVIVYTITQIAKFSLQWLTIYLPNCKAWVGHSDVAAMGYFLDRVLDACFLH